MRNVMSSVVCPSVLGVLVVISAACSSQGPTETPRGSKRIVPATIFLTPTGNVAAPCNAKVAPGRLQVRKNEDADWTIIDLCGGTKGYTVDVELRWSRANPTCGGLYSPLEPTEGDPKGKRNIKRGINRSCKVDDVFSYEVWLGGTLLADPELEIAM